MIESFVTPPFLPFHSSLILFSYNLYKRHLILRIVYIGGRMAVAAIHYSRETTRGYREPVEQATSPTCCSRSIRATTG